MRRSPRARGVFSRIRQTASAVIRNHTWRPSGLSSAPYQRVRPLGSRPEARGVRRPGPGAGPATVGPPANRGPTGQDWPSRAAASMAWSRGSSSWPGCGGTR